MAFDTLPSSWLASLQNNNLGGLSFYENETGKYVVGADSVPKKLGAEPLEIIVKGMLDLTNIGYAYGYAIVNNMGWKTIKVVSTFRPLTINFYSGELATGTLMRTNTNPAANTIIDIPDGTKSIEARTQSGTAQLLLDV